MMNNDIPPISQERLCQFIPQRPANSHKGMFGQAAIIGGDQGMIGAPLLAGRAALKLGAGCVHIGFISPQAPSVDITQPELMLHAAAQLLDKAKISVLALGCGMGRSDIAKTLLQQALSKPIPLILDADALNILAEHSDLQQRCRLRTAATLMTPHPGEAARLLQRSTQYIQQQRSESATQLAQHFNAHIVLKGCASLCATPQGELSRNPHGNPGMSSAGMGDTLTGILCALIAQQISPWPALQLAVLLHSKAADQLAKEQICIGMSASEVIDKSRILFNQMQT